MGLKLNCNRMHLPIIQYYVILYQYVLMIISFVELVIEAFHGQTV